MLTGSCCCGAIQFTLSSPPTMMGTCHCTRCRKVGASTLVFVQREAFTLVAGEVALAGRYPSRSDLARWAGIALPATESPSAGNCYSGGACC